MDKKDYQSKMEEQFTQLSIKIGELLGKAEARAKSEYDKQMATLPDKLKAARIKLEELEAASSDAWEDMKPGLEKAWDELKKSVEKAKSRFK
ncbi:MAG TPA: coiled coil domain-containing protein [Acidobacteriota bacterium]